MRYNILITAVLAAATGTAAHAQLAKEITIEREIVPEVRAASRLDLFPKALTFDTGNTRLNFANHTSLSEITPGIETLGAARTNPALFKTPYRGYVDATYFPVATAGISAGYAIVDNGTTRLNAWGQFNNLSYKDRPFSDRDKATYHRLLGAAGIDFATKIAEAGTLRISTDFAYRSFDNPDHLLLESLEGADASTVKSRQGTIAWNIGAGWYGHNSSGLRYHANLDFGLFNFTQTTSELGVPTAAGIEVRPVLPVHQSMMGVKFGASQLIGDAHTAGVEISADVQGFNHFRETNTIGNLTGIYYQPDTGSGTDLAGAMAGFTDPEGKSIGLVTLTPYYRYAPYGGVVNLKVGARVDLSIHSGKAVHVAPDITFGLNPASGFGAWIKLDGGEHMNTIQSLAEFTPYISPLMAYNMSNIPIKGQLGLRIGPFKGAALTMDVAYAAANSWLMPVWENNTSSIIFDTNNLRSWKAGVHLTWDYRSIVALEAGFETLLSDGCSHAWFEWRDRSRSRFNASVSVRPVDRLTIDLGYTMALRRRMTVTWISATDLPDEEFDLKNSNRLNAGVSYGFSEAFSVFARVENILNDRAYESVAIPGQGVTGAIGFGLKF